MSEKENSKKIDPFVLNRPCNANFDASKLALQDVKQINSHYSRKIILLQDADVMVKWSSDDVKRFFHDVALKDLTDSGFIKWDDRGSIIAYKTRPDDPMSHLAPRADGLPRKTLSGPVWQRMPVPPMNVTYSLGLMYRYRRFDVSLSHGLGI